MRSLAVDEANLIGLIISLVLYGAYASILFTTLWVYKTRRAIRVDTVRCAVITLFLLSTGSMILFIVDNCNAWLRYRISPGTQTYFERHDTAIGPCKDLFWSLAVVVADGLMVWRLYVIWSRSIRVIIVPIIGILLNAVCSIIICALAFRFDLVDTDKPYPTKIMTMLTGASLIVGLLINIYTTSFIVGRLWWTSRQVQQVSSFAENPDSRYIYRQIVRAVVESGTLYTVVNLATLIVGSSVTNAFVIFAYVDAMIVGITPTLLVLLLHKNMVKARERKSSAVVVSTGIRFSPMVQSSATGAQVDIDTPEEESEDKYDGGEVLGDQSYQLHSIQRSQGDPE
ncbi:hypothetical protein FRB94_010094 [Tulasnella sp. JGI-2019a]|nr:hypothetical protein FRB93_004903 [Tulasnella sp. JGI-2019a]KAG8994123.1 hypothetical protein FRB94_010094 [Tulasnella sp. JGI-2019a]